MLSHVMVGTNDMPKAVAYYDELLTLLGAKTIMQFPNTTVWGVGAPQFAVCRPFDGAPATVGNGTMVALSAPSRAQVDAFYAKALALGGTDEGAPGVRGEEAHGFYAAYFRDLDGNKLCVYRVGPAD